MKTLMKKYTWFDEPLLLHAGNEDVEARPEWSVSCVNYSPLMP